MFFWSIAIAVTAIACAALLYAGRIRTVNATIDGQADTNRQFRLLLDGIEQDRAAGKLGAKEADAARGELAREMLRQRGEQVAGSKDLGRGPIAIGIALVVIVTFGFYAALGRPDLPAQPLASRPEVLAQAMNLDDAIARIETALKANPDDARGWGVIAPAYLEQGRYADAVAAYRRVLELEGANAAIETSLAEALLFEAQGQGSEEAMMLLRQAATADLADPKPRLYLAAELTRQGKYAEAAEAWEAAIALAEGSEPWLPAAQQGLAVAQSNGVGAPQPDQQAMIAQMVSGLAERLDRQGGSIEEWTQLVRAYLVLGEKDKAQAAYTDAVAAYPAAFDRGDLDAVALGGGLVLNGDKS